MTSKIIFVPHYEESFKTLLPLALYVRDNKIGSPHFVLYFDHNTEVRQILQKHGIDFSIYKAGFLTKIPMLSRGFKILADITYSVRLTERLFPVQAMVCTVESNEFEYALISVLNRMNINTVVLQWAQTAPNEYELRLEREGKKGFITIIAEYSKSHLRRLVEKLFRVKYSRLYGDGDAKYFAVMGKYYKEMFYKQGVSEDKLIVTGHPEHDYLFQLSSSVRKPGFKQNTLKSFGLDSAKPLWIVAREAIVHFKLVPEENDKEDICAILEILTQYHQDVQIILKLHPRDSKEYYDFVKEKFKHVILIHECDLYKLIAVCDLYISQISSTMMWAIALDKPVVSYDFNNQSYWHYFRDREGIIKADSPPALAKKIEVIQEKGLSPENHRMCQVAKREYMTLDGKACERITGLITK
jgi:hypothetical protein